MEDLEKDPLDSYGSYYVFPKKQAPSRLMLVSPNVSICHKGTNLLMLDGSVRKVSSEGDTNAGRLTFWESTLDENSNLWEEE